VLLLVALLFAPGAVESTFNSAAAALSRGDLSSAEQGFRRVLKSQPNNIGALGNLGVIYSRTGRTREAIGVYQQAMRHAPNDPGLLLNLGLAHLKEENHAAARPLFERLVTAHPGNTRARELLATTLVYTNDAAKAMPILESLPSSPSVFYLLGLANLKLGNPEKARQYLDESLPAAMTPAQAAMLRGKAHYDATLFDDAIREYRKARELDPTVPGVSLELARALVSIRDNEAAETELRGILKAQPKDAEAAYLLGALLVLQGKEGEAEPLLQMSRAAHPDAWGSYFYLGRAKLQASNAKAAVPLLEKASELNPDESAVLYQLSRALKAVGRDAESRKAAARVAELKRQGIDPDQQTVIVK
jgi:Flp pilus assembly protein TadD